MANAEADLLIVGGGVAGISAAYFASLAGRRTTLIDSGEHSASQVPTALVNPVRGYQGKLIDRGLEGARFTFDLIAGLCASGHAIPHGRGLWRPAPDVTVRDLWRTALAGLVPHQWHDEAPRGLGLAGEWTGALFLPESGWVESRRLLAAMLAEAVANGRCTSIRDLVIAIDVPRRTVTLRDGGTIKANDLLWCGGAWGAWQLGYPASFRPGSLIVTDTRLGDTAISYGLYAAPHRGGSVVGPTTEPITKIFDHGPSPAAWLSRTSDRATQMFGRELACQGVWHGVRLEQVLLPCDLPHLSGFGSRGYLLAPLVASEWVQERL